MDKEVTSAMKTSESCRERLAISSENLKAYFAKLRRDFQKHLSVMEKQTTDRLAVLTEEQTKNITRAEEEIKNRLSSFEESSRLKSALKRLNKYSDVSLDFEISPDLDRLRFLSEFGILRVKNNRTSDRDQDDEDRGTIIKDRQSAILEQSPNQSLSNSRNLKETCFGNCDSRTCKHSSNGNECGEQDENELTTDSGFVHVSQHLERDSCLLTKQCTKGNSNTKKSETASQLEENNTLPFRKAESEVTSSTNETFVTMEDGKLIAFSNTGGYIKLLSKECSMLATLQVKYPKAICCVKKNSVLVVVETPSHDKIWVMKVAGNELVKVNAFRIKCHDRICDISYKCSSLYVMCSGNHLHIVDT